MCGEGVEGERWEEVRKWRVCVCVCVVGGEGVEMEEKVLADFKSSRLCTLYGKVLNESPTFLELRWRDWRASH